MPKVFDKAIIYDGTILTFKKVTITSKGFTYFFHEIPYGLKENEFQPTSIPFS